MASLAGIRPLRLQLSYLTEEKKTRELGNKNQSVATLQQMNTQIPLLCRTNHCNPASLLCFGMSIRLQADAATQKVEGFGVSEQEVMERTKVNKYTHELLLATI